MTEQEVWQEFEKMMEAARLGGAQGSAPVAAVILPIKGLGDREATLDLEGQVRVIWPSDFPESERATLLRRVADAYESGQVLRTYGRVERRRHADGR